MGKGDLAVVKGLWLSPDDHLRKAVIESLICNGYLDFAKMASRFEIDFESYFAKELQDVLPLAEDGLLEFTNRSLRILPRGQILISNICMIWDQYLKPTQPGENMYSQTA